MAIVWTRRLSCGAALANGALAGMNVNRSLVEMPTWQRVGPLDWAAFSRHADLGPVGRLLYPSLALAVAILSLAAAVPIYGAPLLTLGGLLVTTRAVPIMLSVPNRGTDPVALQPALNGFQFWGNLRGAFQVLAFVANLWSLVPLSAPAPRSAAASRSQATRPE